MSAKPNESLESVSAPDADLEPKHYSRRVVLELLGASMGGLVTVACGSGDPANPDASDATADLPTDTADDGTVCVEVPEETEGPFPADGSQSSGTNVLTDSRIVRSDITSDLDGTDTQDGTELELTMTIVNAYDSCEPVKGAAVYIWHCNADGDYSAYSGSGNADYRGYTFLRGVQVTDDDGKVTFKTIYPGRYSGRATHIHFEVYSDDSFDTLLKTSQLAFDEDINDTVYESSSTYSDSESTQATSNDSDNIFADGYDDQMLSISGSPSAGYTATITVGVSA